MVKKSALSKSGNSNSVTFYNKLNSDTQRQVSYQTRRLERKLSNDGWTKHILRTYNDILNNDLYSLDKIQRFGIPKQGQYITEQADQIIKYIQKNPDTKLGKRASDIYTKVNKQTGRLISKMERYNLHVPRTIEPKESPKYNGERIHIKLEEVL